MCLRKRNRCRLKQPKESTLCTETIFKNLFVHYIQRKCEADLENDAKIKEYENFKSVGVIVMKEIDKNERENREKMLFILNNIIIYFSWLAIILVGIFSLYLVFGDNSKYNHIMTFSIISSVIIIFSMLIKNIHKRLKSNHSFYA